MNIREDGDDFFVDPPALGSVAASVGGAVKACSRISLAKTQLTNTRV